MNRIRILRNILAAVAIAVVSLSARAEVKYLVVNFNDGTEAGFALADDPVLTNTASELQISTAEKTITVAFGDLKNYQFADNFSGLSEKKLSDESFRLLPDVIFFTGLQKRVPVKVFSLDGKILAGTMADEEGRASIGLASLPSGICIISCGSKSFKVKIP